MKTQCKPSKVVIHDACGDDFVVQAADSAQHDQTPADGAATRLQRDVRVVNVSGHS